MPMWSLSPSPYRRRMDEDSWSLGRRATFATLQDFFPLFKIVSPLHVLPIGFSHITGFTKDFTDLLPLLAGEGQVTGTPVVRSRRAELSSAPARKPRVSPPCPCLPGFSADQLGAERTLQATTPPGESKLYHYLTLYFISQCGNLRLVCFAGTFPVQTLPVSTVQGRSTTSRLPSIMDHHLQHPTSRAFGPTPYH